MDALKKFQEALNDRRFQHADYIHTFSSPEGQRVLKDICDMGFINKSSFNPMSRDKTILNEGSRLLALAILKKLHKQPRETVTESILETNT